jgi:hypothetical protein
MRKLIFILSFISIGFAANAQYAEDALRYSRNYFGGTARMQGMAGAQQALGADLSSLVGNPAGLGFYRRNDFSISPVFRTTSTDSKYFGKTSNDNNNQMNIGNLGFSLTQINQDYSGNEVQKGWVSYTFAMGMNRIDNFYENKYFKGLNTNSSISNYYAEVSNDRDARYFPDSNITSTEDMAWYGYMIDFDTTSNKFVSLSNGNVTQAQADRLEGYHNEWNFSFGANYSNILYLGASLGLGSIKYNRTSKFTETGIVDPIYGLSSIALNEKLNVTGSSLNLKVGAIVRPADFVRIGLSIQTPDYYTIDEGFITDLSSVSSVGSSTYTPLEYLFNYKLRTPFRYQGGIALFFKKFGLLSADVERIDYSNNKLSASAEFSDFGPAQNAVIENIYQNTYNVRLGAELKAGPFSFRGGYANYGDPYKSSVVDGNRTFITAGLGYRFEEYYLDFAFINQQYNSQYSPYTLSNSDLSPIVENNHNINSVVVTFGTKF